jgi:hypothetical protein
VSALKAKLSIIQNINKTRIFVVCSQRGNLHKIHSSVLVHCLFSKGHIIEKEAFFDVFSKRGIMER